MEETRRIDLCGIGAALMDVLVDVEEADLTDIGLPKGDTTHRDARSQEELLSRIGMRRQVWRSGGSTATSALSARILGSRAAFVTGVGDDPRGTLLLEELGRFGVEVVARTASDEATGTCVALLTPDAERTLSTCQGASGRLGPADVPEELIAASRWLLIDGYLLATPAHGGRAARRAAEIARRHGTRVAMTLSSVSIVERFRDAVEGLVGMADILFGNAAEAAAYAGTSELEEALGRFATDRRDAVITSGADGSLVRSRGRTFVSPAFPAEPRDTTGAGDWFAGAFIHGLAMGLDGERAARGASRVAALAISEDRETVARTARALWEEAVR